MRRSLAALTGVFALAAAGCGGGGGGGGDASLPDAASVVPASAPILITAHTDFSSDQWKKVAALFAKFPDGNKLLTQVQKGLGGVQLSELGTAVGSEVDVAVLGFENGGSAVALTKPKEQAKLKELLASSKQPPVTEDVGGWTVLASDRAKLDQFDQARKGGTLDGSSTFKDAMKQAASGAEATIYVDGKAVQDALQKRLARSGTAAGSFQDFGSLDWLVASAIAKDNGVAITGDAHGSLKNRPSMYKPALPGELPSGALAYVSFAHLDRPIGLLYKSLERVSPTFKAQLSQAEGVLGLSIENDVLPIFSGEGALAVYPATGKTLGRNIPGIALVEKVSDAGKARTLLGRLSSLAALAGGTLKVSRATVAGVPAQRFRYGGATIYAAVFDGKLVVTNAKSIISGLHGGSRTALADDRVYKQAASAAGLPGNVLGFVYLNLRKGLPAIFGLAERAGRTVPKAARDNTAPLRSFLAYSTGSGQDYRFGGFLTIK